MTEEKVDGDNIAKPSAANVAECSRNALVEAIVEPDPQSILPSCQQPRGLIQIPPHRLFKQNVFQLVLFFVSLFYLNDLSISRRNGGSSDELTAKSTASSSA